MICRHCRQPLTMYEGVWVHDATKGRLCEDVSVGRDKPWNGST